MQSCLVIAALSRNPVVVWHWIPGQARDDNLTVRDDNLTARDDKLPAGDESVCQAHQHDLQMMISVSRQIGFHIGQ